MARPLEVVAARPAIARDQRVGRARSDGAGGNRSACMSAWAAGGGRHGLPRRHAALAACASATTGCPPSPRAGPAACIAAHTASGCGPPRANRGATQSAAAGWAGFCTAATGRSAGSRRQARSGARTDAHRAPGSPEGERTSANERGRDPAHDARREPRGGCDAASRGAKQPRVVRQVGTCELSTTMSASGVASELSPALVSTMPKAPSAALMTAEVGSRMCLSGTVVFLPSRALADRWIIELRMRRLSSSLRSISHRSAPPALELE
eukprot:scaffold26500_cov101-Isochrysis_galbana.AAC.5